MLSLPWRRWFHRGRTLRRARRFRAPLAAERLALERLEDRCLLAAPASLGAYGHIALSFEANQGQTAAEVDFLARGPGYALFLTPTGAVLTLQQVDADPGDKDSLHVTATDVVELQLVGAQQPSGVGGIGLQSFETNYFIGNDPAQWQTNIANYAKVQYENVYPGIDLIYYGKQSQLEYDFVVAPGADPAVIALSFAGPKGMEIDAQGDLVLHTSAGDVLQRAPFVYQNVNGEQQQIDSRFVVDDAGQVSFHLGSYDAGLPLVIDPELNYSTYYGGTGPDRGNGIAVDDFGNAYVTGTTASIDFPIALPAMFGRIPNSSFDVFVAKVNAGGTGFVYSTYFGGAGSQNATDIAVDKDGNAFIVGYTNATNLPVSANAAQATYGGGNQDAFATIINPSGSSLIYSTYLGGAGDDHGFSIALDTSGNAFVTGSTTSSIAGAAANSPGMFRTSAGAAQALQAFQNAYKTINGGSLWTTSNSGMLDATTTAFAIDPTNTATVYAATFGGGVFKSTNGGATWAALNTGLSGAQANLNVNALIADSAGNIYAGTNGGGVFRLPQGSSTWTSLGTGLGNPFVNTLVFGTNGNLYAGTNGGVFSLAASVWTGATTGITNSVVQELVSDSANAGTLYAGTAGGGVFKTVNGGTSWVAVNAGLGNLDVKGLVLDRNAASPFQGNLYAAVVGDSPFDGGIFRSTNGGQSWLLADFGVLNFSFRALALDPIGNAYAATEAGVFKSLDGGVSWNIFNAGFANVSISALATDPATPGVVYAGAEQTAAGFATKLSTGATGTGAILYSTLLAGSRDQQGHGVAVDATGNAYVTGYTTSIDFPVTPTALQGFNGDEKSFRTTDGGNNWFVTDNNLPRGTFQALAASRLGANTVYGGTLAGGVFKSTDGGVTWTPSNTGLTNLTVNALVAAQTGAATEILYAGTNSGVFVSTDQGATWTTTANALPGLRVIALAVLPGTPGTLFAGTEASGVFFSSNSGASFAARNAGLDTLRITAMAISATGSGTRIYAGTRVFGFYESFDFGLSWGAFNKGLPGDVVVPPNLTVTSLIVDPFGSVYMGVQSNGLGIGIWKSTFSPWANFSTGLSSLNISTFAIDPTDSDTLYAGSSDGGVFKTQNSGLTWNAKSGVTLGTFNPNRLTNFNVTALAVNLTGATVNAGFFQNLVPTADAFITKLNPAGTGILYSTYLGGNQDDISQGIALNPQADVYITGYTNSGAYPIVNPLQRQNVIHPGGTFGYDALITRVNVTQALPQNQLIYSTFLGGGISPNIFPDRNPQGDDYGNGIAVDTNGNAYIVGNTTSVDFPVTNTAFQSGFGGGLNQGDAFVARITPNPGIDFTGNSPDGEAPPDYASYLGGNGDDAGLAIAIDPTFNQYVTGFTGSTNFPLANPAQGTIGGNNFGGLYTDAFITKIVPIPTTTTVTIQVAPSALGTQFVDVTLTSILASASPSPFGTAFTLNTFFDGPTALGTGVSDSKGNQVLTVRGVDVTSNHLYFAWFGGDLNHLPSKSLPVQLIATTTEVTAAANGQLPTFTATVTPVTPGVTPTGYVTFLDNLTVLPGQPVINPTIPGNTGVPVSDRGIGQQRGIALVNGTASYTPPAGFTPGSYAITAIYSGDLIYLPSTSPVLQQALPQTATVTSVSVDIAGPAFGQKITLTAVSQPLTANIPLPAGTVVFRDGNTVIGEAQLVNGLATRETTSLAVGTHSIIAFYSGAPGYSTSSSAAITVTVNKATTAVTIDTTPLPPVVGQPLAFAIKVSAVAPGQGTPTGDVTITDGLATLGSRPLNNGAANFTVPSLTAGPHAFTVTYNGDKNFLTSKGQVSLGATKTVVITSAPSSPFGDTITYTATVTPLPPASGTPTGTVTFFDGTTIIDVPKTLSGGVTQVITSTLSIGQHTILAMYSGDLFFASSTGTVPQTITKGNVVVTPGSTPNPSAQGSPVTLTATIAVKVSSVSATGTVTFVDTIQGSLGTATVNKNGLATLQISTLTAGSHSIVAKYSGDNNYVPKDSDPITQRVLPAAAVTVTSSLNPSALDRPVTFTVTAAAIPPTPGLPTGTVELFDGATSLGVAPLQNGTASFTISTLTVGSHSITAKYSGDDNFAANTSAPLTQLVALNSIFATGTDAGGGPNILVFDAVTKAVKFNFFAYDPLFTGGVRVAIGDINGDSAPDIITAPGPGGGPDIHVYDGTTGGIIRQFFAFNPLFTGGQYVAAADLDGDGRAEIIVGADKGGGPNVTVFRGDGIMLSSFFPYDPAFRGGVRVAGGDVDGDGRAEIITVPGPGGGPTVAVFAGATNPTKITSFFAFNQFFSQGFFVAAGDVDGSGDDEIIVGIDAGSVPTVGVYDPFTGEQLQAFSAYDPGFTGGVRVGVDFDVSRRANILTTPGPGGGPQVRIFSGLSDTLIDEFFAYNPLFTGGLFIAGGR